MVQWLVHLILNLAVSHSRFGSVAIFLLDGTHCPRLSLTCPRC